MITYVSKRTGETFRWSGGATCFCTNCHQLFTGPDAFDEHYTSNGAGVMTCKDPATVIRLKDNQLVFEKVDKPEWSPTHVWRRNRPGRAPHPEAD